jgi:hypothetical protein
MVFVGWAAHVPVYLPGDASSVAPARLLLTDVQTPGARL